MASSREPAILAVNAGSSSLKFALFAAGPGEPVEELRGTLHGVGGSQPSVRATRRNGQALSQQWAGGRETEHLYAEWLSWLQASCPALEVAVVAHRVVHGGDAFTAPVRIDAPVLRELEALTPLAPLHQPKSLAPVHAFRDLAPGLVQVACFDTAFHASLRAPARRYGLPHALEDSGIRRFGFHGLSYEFVAGELARELADFDRQRIVVAHLGSGASACAMRGGRSVDTTMGFSVLDGLLMGTRCGSIDPGVLLYLMRERGMSAKALEHLLYEESGLKGVSGISADVRELEQSDEPAADEALELFTFRAAREIAGLCAALGGLDCLVFTGGIGEHDAGLRAAICGRLGWVGVALDAEANRQSARVISPAGNRIGVLVVPTDEECSMARHAARWVRAEGEGFPASVTPPRPHRFQTMS